MWKILHVGLGPLGRKIAEDLHERKLGSVVAAIDVSPELAGKPLSSVVPGADSSVTIQESLEGISNWRGVDAAIVSTSSSLIACAPTFRAFLQKGLPVVSTCEELVFPWFRHRELAQELHQLAFQHGGRLLGTGVNPGFLMDALPLFATAVCKSVRSVRIERIQDASDRRIPFQQKIGAGLDEKEFQERVASGKLRHVGLGESLHFLAHFLGIPIESWEESIQPVFAERDLESGVGRIPKSRIAGVRQMAQGRSGGRTVIRLEFQAAVGQENPHDRIMIEGDPGIDLEIRGGVHGDTATSAIVLNAIPSLRKARPGLHNMATLSPVYHASAPA